MKNIKQWIGNNADTIFGVVLIMNGINLMLRGLHASTAVYLAVMGTALLAVPFLLSFLYRYLEQKWAKEEEIKNRDTERMLESIRRNQQITAFYIEDIISKF